MPYKYGPYGEIVDSKAQMGVYTDTIPVYVGTLPIHLVRGYKDRDLVNRPFKVRSLADAQNNAGYAPDWDKYTLCEAIAAHFDNSNGAVGPIYLVNVLDPEDAKSETVHTTATLTNGKAEIAGTDMVLDSFVIHRPALEGTYQTSEIRANGPAGTVSNYKYGEAYASAGVTYDSGAINYKPTGEVAPEIVHEGYAYVGISFDAPTGATAVTVKVNGKTAFEDADLKANTDNVHKGKPVIYFKFAKADGTALPANYWKLDFDWAKDGGNEQTVCEIGLNDGLNYIEGKDYSLSYSTAHGAAVIEDTNRAMPQTISVDYDVVDPKEVTEADIIGEATADGRYTGIQAIKRLFMEQGVIANLLLAPGWSHRSNVYRALCNAARKMNGHWDGFVLADLPVEYNGKLLDTFESIVAWKTAHQFDDERSKVFWPLAMDDADPGRIFHISTLACAEIMRLDYEHDGIPYETCGNKVVPVVKQYFGEGSTSNGYDKDDANEITQHGISTIAPWANTWTLWGDHTAAYEYGNDYVDPRQIFDVSIRMLMYITNSFQRQWVAEIDQPMTRALKDTILNIEQEKLDALVARGALIGHPRVEFLEEENSVDDMMQGWFVFNIDVTPTPPLKAATVKVAYTDSGFAVYFEDGE